MDEFGRESEKGYLSQNQILDFFDWSIASTSHKWIKSERFDSSHGFYQPSTISTSLTQCRLRQITKWSIFHINQSKYLSRQALLFPTWDWRRSYSIKANKLACYQPNSLDAPSRRTKLACHQPASLVCLVRCQPIPPSYLIVWFALFVVNQPNRHIWRLDLSYLLPTVIFDCLICLVCYPPISPNYHHCFQKR